MALETTLRRLLPFLLLGCGACLSPTATELDQLLVHEPAQPTDSDSEASELSPVQRADRQAAQDMEAARAAPEDIELALQASRSLFLAADARMLDASLARIAKETLTVEEIIDIESRLSSQLRADVLGLVLEGDTWARSILQDHPEHHGALLYHALHLSLEAWARGSTSALLNGLGSKVPTAIRASIDADDSFESAAPLRLMGRFLDRAPWPVGDRKQAIQYLRMACERAPVALNWLYLGDALWLAGQEEEARAAWHRVAGSEPGPALIHSASQQRELALIRLARVDDDGRAAP